jgi:hypothetical protein
MCWGRKAALGRSTYWRRITDFLTATSVPPEGGGLRPYSYRLSADSRADIRVPVAGHSTLKP